ncbi:MAG: hypothetical protein AAF329_20570 [Cyanobacteria bacterium P01_A01_bin.17]
MSISFILASIVLGSSSAYFSIRRWPYHMHNSTEGKIMFGLQSLSSFACSLLVAALVANLFSTFYTQPKIDSLSDSQSYLSNQPQR